MDRAGQQQSLTTAREAGMVGCTYCGLLLPMDQAHCPRCGAGLQSRDDQSLQKVWAWLLAGLIAYVPANLYPMLRTTQMFHTTESTIVGGVSDLIHHHAYGIAFIVFFASVVIPIGKFIVIAYLAYLMSRPHKSDPHRLHLLYEVVEFIGRWSMIDVFVVAILTALVQFDVLATINPGIAAVCFALSVVFTMLSAQSFDSRLIWDRLEKGSFHG
ncbi:paraquat-inducible protein A [Pseudoprimorskyibacter insulae]|uniref:Paraquat-inducible protein A n=1 Tax=Pseudoprimorskyibacter insulae TaxID=1695997 RepID=A0A2R8B040_9RHOB|nr:paraquat-inducible protein A [Pseudoprimorskyibacter insulae]SPF81665.1 Paraquat-inducible protein A [Pseudoprimorskyibacter insulae]